MTDQEIEKIFQAGNVKSYAAGLRAVFQAGVDAGKPEPEPEPVEAPKKKATKK
jgi:hypothetical protein